MNGKIIKKTKNFVVIDKGYAIFIYQKGDDRYMYSYQTRSSAMRRLKILMSGKDPEFYRSGDHR